VSVSVFVRQQCLVLRGSLLCLPVSTMAWIHTSGSGVPPLPDYLPATPWVYYTASCKHSLVLLKMGETVSRNMSSCLRIINKSLSLHVVGCLHYLFTRLFILFTRLFICIQFRSRGKHVSCLYIYVLFVYQREPLVLQSTYEVNCLRSIKGKVQSLQYFTNHDALKKYA
jgi:hypothetical protein